MFYIRKMNKMPPGLRVFIKKIGKKAFIFI